MFQNGFMRFVLSIPDVMERYVLSVPQAIRTTARREYLNFPSGARSQGLFQHIETETNLKIMVKFLISKYIFATIPTR